MLLPASLKGLGVGNSGNGLIITSYFIHSLIVLKIFVKLSKWQVPQGGAVMRLKVHEWRCWVHLRSQSTAFIDCSLWAEVWAGPTCLCSVNWYWMSMKRKL